MDETARLMRPEDEEDDVDWEDDEDLDDDDDLEDDDDFDDDDLEDDDLDDDDDDLDDLDDLDDDDFEDDDEDTDLTAAPGVLRQGRSLFGRFEIALNPVDTASNDLATLNTRTYEGSDPARCPR